MVAAMAGFALEDVFFKQMATRLPVGQALALVGAGGGILFSVVAVLSGKPLLSRALLSRPVVLRNLSEALGSAAFVSALVLTSLSGASAVLQATPLAVTLGAALFFGESVGWRRWTAIAIGFLGVLCIVKPGLAGFESASLLAVCAVLMLALRDLCSRALPATIASIQVAAWGFLSIAPAGLLMMLGMHTAPLMLAGSDVLLLCATLLFGCLAYYALIAATRAGDVSAIVPFRYTRLVFSMLLGGVVFGERPDVWMVTGAVLIVGTGLYSAWRSAVARR